MFISIQSWEQKERKKERKTKKIDKASEDIVVPSQSSDTAHRAVVFFQSILPLIAIIEILRFL